MRQQVEYCGTQGPSSTDYWSWLYLYETTCFSNDGHEQTNPDLGFSQVVL